MTSDPGVLTLPKEKRFWAAIPSWIFLGAVAVLFPVFALMTAANINRQKEITVRMLLEKGAALIRSFEAGTRTGMMALHFGRSQLQKLLTETAQQPDIAYLMVSDTNGLILAHGDATQIGKIHPAQGIDLKEAALLKTLKYREIVSKNGKSIFEVFGRFSPTGIPIGGERRRMHRMFHDLFNDDPPPEDHADLPPDPFSPPFLIIFVGLDMTAAVEAQQADIRHTIFMAAILLLIGFSGVIFLFLAQNYRAARVTISRIKAFSDTLVENLPIGLLALDSQGRIAVFNSVADNLLLLTEKEAFGKFAGQVLPKALYSAVFQVSPEKRIMDAELDCLMDSGANLPIEFSAAPLKDESDGFSGIVVLFRDMSELKSLRREIALNQRLASVGRLAAGVAHEIRNPLSSIKGFATYFKERYAHVTDDSKTADFLIAEVDRLNRVVTQLLELARPMKISKRLTSLNKLIEDSLELIRRQADAEKIRLFMKLPSESVFAELDPDRFSQVLWNLYLNAIESMKAVTGEKRITVSVEVDHMRNRFYIKVSDSGCGIAVEDISNIFDPFFTRKRSGTGLGLSIVQNIVEAHGGSLRVDSEPEKGTVITLAMDIGRASGAMTVTLKPIPFSEK
jgi:two-component system sensor histidine kinase HydH